MQDLPRRGLSCPDDTTLAAYIDGAVDASQRARIEGHVSNCRYCLAQVGFALRLQGEELPPVPRALAERVQSKAPAREFASGWRWATATALAACALVSAILVSRKVEAPPTVQIAAVQQQPAPRPDSTLPATRPVPDMGGPQERAERSRTLPSVVMLTPKSGAVLSRNEVQFRWTKAPSALYYRVRIATAEGNLVWDSDKVENQNVLLPPTVELKPGQQYFVWVHAYMSEGKIVRTSATSFTVEP